MTYLLPVEVADAPELLLAVGYILVVPMFMYPEAASDTQLLCANVTAG